MFNDCVKMMVNQKDKQLLVVRFAQKERKFLVNYFFTFYSNTKYKTLYKIEQLKTVPNIDQYKVNHKIN